MSDHTATANWLVASQLNTGMIPWGKGLHGDPWNHSEALIALALEGRLDAVEKGMAWLAKCALPDGALFQYYLASGVKEPKVDLNCCLYPAVAMLGYLGAGGDPGVIKEHLRWFDETTELVLRFQRADGGFPWALGPDRNPLAGSLVAGSAAMVLSLDALMTLDIAMGRVRSDISEARAGLAEWFRKGMPAALDKGEWAMDGYYPVLAGVLGAKEGCDRFAKFAAIHLLEPYGVRALSHSNWFTTAETAEAAMALAELGMYQQAGVLLDAARRMRLSDGSYVTGRVVPELNEFPRGECTTYSAAAVIIADHVIASQSRLLEVVAG